VVTLLLRKLVPATQCIGCFVDFKTGLGMLVIMLLLSSSSSLWQRWWRWYKLLCYEL